MIRFIAFYLALTLSASAADIPRSYQGTIVKVVDGDTIIASVVGWPAPFNPVEVRLDGIDTPESRSQDARCSKELKLGLIAKAWMKDKLPVGTKVTLVWTGEREKFGRLLAKIVHQDIDINELLVKKGFAIHYQGGTKSSWCG